MPLVFDASPTKGKRQYTIFQLQYPSDPDIETREVDAWICETEDLSDPGIHQNECIWGMTTRRLFGGFRADFWITRVPGADDDVPDLRVGNTKDRTKVGWRTDHPLRGKLLPASSISSSPDDHTSPRTATRRFHQRLGMQGLKNPISFVEVSQDVVRHLKNGNEIFALDIQKVTPEFSPKGWSQVLGYGDLVLHFNGQRVQVDSLADARSARSFIQAMQRHHL